MFKETIVVGDVKTIQSRVSFADTKSLRDRVFTGFKSRVGARMASHPNSSTILQAFAALSRGLVIATTGFDIYITFLIYNIIILFLFVYIFFIN